MRSFAAVTSFDRRGYELYGRELLESFDRHWPAEVRLTVYAEGFTPELPSARVEARDLLAESPGLLAFKERHRDDPRAHGQRDLLCLQAGLRLRPLGLLLRRVHWGQGFRWDAVRFSHKSFATFAAVRERPADVLFWLDGDMRFLDDVPRSLLEEIVPHACLVAYLKRAKNGELAAEWIPAERRLRFYHREGKHPETGIVGYNLAHPAIGDFFATFESLYADDSLFEEREFTDAYLFDRVRERFERQGHPGFDIAEGIGRVASHPLVNSRLGRYMDHLKGERKQHGSSHEADRLARS